MMPAPLLYWRASFLGVRPDRRSFGVSRSPLVSQPPGGEIPASMPRNWRGSAAIVPNNKRPMPVCHGGGSSQPQRVVFVHDVCLPIVRLILQHYLFAAIHEASVRSGAGRAGSRV